MAGSTASNYLHNKFMGLLLRGQTYIPPTTIWVALVTTVGNADGTGFVEVSTSGTAYARKGILQDVGWSGASGVNQEYSNSAEITFDVPTADWGTVRGVMLMDAEVGGNMLYYGTLTSPKTVSNGDGAPRILANQLKLSRATC